MKHLITAKKLQTLMLTGLFLVGSQSFAAVFQSMKFAQCIEMDLPDQADECEKIGRKIGRDFVMPYLRDDFEKWFFDPYVYLKTNRDLLPFMVNYGQVGYGKPSIILGALNHWRAMINDPNVIRVSTDIFDPYYYYAIYPDVAASCRGQGTYTYKCAAKHFFDFHLDRIGSAKFSAKIYIQNYPVLLAPYAPNELNGAINHYIFMGVFDGLKGR